jgi:hypothetical protein
MKREALKEDIPPSRVRKGLTNLTSEMLDSFQMTPLTFAMLRVT